MRKWVFSHTEKEEKGLAIRFRNGVTVLVETLCTLWKISVWIYAASGGALGHALVLLPFHTTGREPV